MAISFRSQTFQDTRSKLNELADAGQLSQDNFDDTVKSLGVDPSDYRSAYSKYKEALEAGEDMESRGALQVFDTEIPVVDSLERVVGRALGSTGEAIVDVSQAFLPDAFNEAVGSVADSLGEYIPEAVKEYASEVFDPYHGEGSYGSGEQVVGEIASYFIPGTAAFKIGKAGLNLAKLSPGARALMVKTGRKVGRKGRKAGQVGGIGLAGAAGTTFIEDPRENLFDQLMEDDAGQEALEKLSQDPNDPTALDYVDAFIKNAAIEVPATFLLGLPSYLRKLYKGSKLSKPREKITPLSKLNQAWSSRMGTDDKTLEKIVKVSGSGKAAAIRADGLAKDLMSTVKKETTYSPEIENKINNALQFSELGIQNAQANLDKVLAKEQRLIDKVNRATTQADTDKALKKLYDYQATEKAAAQNTLIQAQRNKVDYDELGNIAPESRNLIDEMRGNIDELSNYLTDNVVRGKLKARIEGNKGLYLNRSYEVFDDPKFRSNLQKRFQKYSQGEVLDDELEGVAQYLRSTGTPEDEIMDKIEQLIPTMDEDIPTIFGMLNKRSANVGSSKVLSQRGDIPDPIRAMWGEVKDPYKNYVKTFEKMARIKAEDEFLKELASDLVSQGIASKGKRDGIRGFDLGSVAQTRLGKVLGRGKVENMKVQNPLEGIYVDEIYRDAITKALDEVEPTGKWAEWFMKAKGATQTAQTVMSPATHGRNLIGNIAILAANGIIPGMNSAGKALEQTAARLAGKNNKELAETAARYAELGITDSGVAVNVIRRNLNAVVDKGGDSYLDKLALTRGIKKTNAFLQNLYQAEDDLFKIIHFEKTKDTLRKAFPDKPIDDIEKMAAQRTRDLMPNYGLVPRAIKDARRLPIGDFVAFPAEMIRTSVNLAKYTLDDVASGNAELRKAGLKRLAGMTAVGLGPTALAAKSRHTNNITDEQEEAINSVGVPEYEMFQDRIYMSGINKDKRGHVGVNYLNLGPLDPYSFIKTAAKGTHKAFFDGGKNDADLGRMGIAMFDQTLGSFLEPSMITKAAMDLVDGKTYEDEVDAMGVTQKALKTAIGPFIPGIYNSLKRRYDYEQTKAGATKFISPFVGDFDFENNANYPEGMKAGRYASTLSGAEEKFGGDVGIPAFFGVRNQRLDLTAGIEYNLNSALRKVRDSDRIYNRFISDPSLYGESDSRAIFEKYRDSQKKKLKGMQELKAMADGYRNIFGEDYTKEILKGLRFRNYNIDDATLDNLNYASQNRFIPTLPTSMTAKYFSGAPVPYDAIRRFYSDLLGTKLIEDE